MKRQHHVSKKDWPIDKFRKIIVSNIEEILKKKEILVRKNNCSRLSKKHSAKKNSQS